ncbi:MAG: hypothetical protein J5966_11230, partial [Lachnospiraceae bacterium]|nr:hypothetical protein [Lachnospiraceae bacterium]
MFNSKLIKNITIIAAVSALLCGCTGTGSAADAIIEAGTTDMVINVTTDYEFMLPEAGEAAQFTSSESGRVYLDEDEAVSDDDADKAEEIGPVDIIETADIHDSLSDEDQVQRTYSLIYFNKPTVTSEELKVYASVNTEEVAARMADFADIYTPERMRAEELSAWDSLSDIDKTAIAFFVKTGWISQEELSDKGIAYDDIIEYIEMDKTDSKTLSENAEGTTLESDTMRKQAPTNVSIAQSVFSKDKVESEEVFLYTGNEINSNTNRQFVDSFMDYINNHTKDELYSLAQSSWSALSTESKRAFVYMLKLNWLEKGRLVQGQVSLAEVDRMYNL